MNGVRSIVLHFIVIFQGLGLDHSSFSSYNPSSPPEDGAHDSYEQHNHHNNNDENESVVGVLVALFGVGVEGEIVTACAADGLAAALGAAVD
jgi:hypothetical protein